MPDINIPWPEKGISEGRANDEQLPRTTREAINVRSVDPTNGRVRGAQRSGMSLFTSTPLVSSSYKVQDIVKLTYDNKKTTYAAFPETTDGNMTGVELPNKGECRQLVVDSQSNVYAIDSKAAIIKYNSELVEIWKANIALGDQAGEIRAIAVDGSFWVYVGVSTGGDMAKARIYAYEQKDNPFAPENEPSLRAERVWEFNAGGFIEKIDIRDGKLYAAVNEVSRGRSWVVVLDQINTAVPIEQRRWDIPYPANDLSVSPKDGSIYTAHEPNTQRGVDLQNPSSHACWVDWTPELLPNFKKRVWGWWDASDIDADGTNNSAYEEGDEITTWYDKSGNNREWEVNTVAVGEKGPLLTKNYIGGRDMLAFDGVNRSMMSGKNPTVANVGTDKSSRSAFLSALPGYAGAQFALFMVVRMTPETTQRVLLGQDINSTHSSSTCRAILANSLPANDLTTVSPAIGSIRITEQTVGSTDAANGPGVNDPPLGQTYGPDDFCLITWVFNGGVGSVKSCIRVNGKAAEQYDSQSNWIHNDATFLGYYRGALTQVSRFRGYVCEMLVLSDWYSGATTPLTSGTLQPLLTVPDQPDASPSNLSTSELQLIEGYLANKWGGAYKLPAGTAQQILFTGQPANDETLTLGSITYTFKLTLSASPSGAGVWVDIGADLATTLNNLYNAINGSGTRGNSTYTWDTSRANTDLYCSGFTHYDDNAARLAVMLHSRTAATTAITFTEAVANATIQNGATTTSAGHQGLSTSYNCNHYPHPYYFVRTTASQTRGGPPSSQLDADTPSGTPISAYTNLHHYGGILCRWNPLSSKLDWVVTSGLDGTTSQVYAGVGYACVADPDGGVYSAGPSQALTTVPMQLTGSASQTSITRFVNDQTSSAKFTQSFSVDLSTQPTTLIGDAHIRMATDKFSNGYIPVFTKSNNTDASQPNSLLVYNKSGTLLHKLYEPQATQLMYSVATDPQVSANITDDLTGATQAAQARAEAVYMSGRLENGASLLVTGNPANKTGFFAAREYTFMATLDPAYSTATQIKIGANISETLSNLEKAVNGTGTNGVDYQYNTVAPNSANITYRVTLRTASVNDGSVFFRRINPVAFEEILPGELYLITSAAPHEGGGSYSDLTGSFQGTSPSDQAAIYRDGVFKAKLVSSSPQTGSPRAVRILAVSNGAIRRIEQNQTPQAVSGGNFSSTASQFVQSTALGQKVYYTNGEQYLVYSPKTDIVEEWKSTSGGKIPPRCKLVDNWRNRIILARSADDPQNWHMSAVGKPTNWDQFPPVTVATQAVSGNNSRAGRCPDIINAIIPYSDDLLIMGGDSSIWRMTGDPMAGGQIDLMSDVDGIAFGRAWDKDDSGALYFFGARGGLYRATPQGGVKKISGETIDTRLREINLGTHYVRLVWNDQDDCLHIFAMPFSNGGVHVKHFVYEARTGGFFQDEFGTAAAGGTGVQPTAAVVIDGDDPNDRTMLVGCEDGYVRRWDAAAFNDGGSTATSAIDSQVVFGPFSFNEETEARLTAVNLLLAKEQQGCRVQLFVSDTPDDLGIAVWTGDFAAGRNDWRFLRGRGRYIWIKIRNSLFDTRWAFENMAARVERAGRARVRQL
jgi:hypothetical protein